MSTEKLSMEQFGAVIHPPEEWPFSTRHHGGPVEKLAADIPVHTTQSHVYSDLVEQKKTAPNYGISVARDEAGQTWLIDGHHTLAASRSAGEAEIDAYVHGPGDNPISPPRLRKGPR